MYHIAILLPITSQTIRPVFCLYDIPIFPLSEVLFEMLTGVHVLTSMCGSDPSGPICEQHLGFWEGNVSHQPICAVLLPARLRSHSDGHRIGPTTGMSASRDETVILFCP